MWGSWGQDLPTFWQCGGPYVLGPPLLPSCSGCQQACSGLTYSCWSCCVTIRIIKSLMIQLYVRPAYMSCHSGESLAGFKLHFPCTHILAQLLLMLPPWVVHCDCCTLWTSAWYRLALFNSNTLMMLWWLIKGCMGQLCSTGDRSFGARNWWEWKIFVLHITETCKI